MEHLTISERAILQAIVERILPSQSGAGARDANVVGYVDWAMNQPFFQPRLRPLLSGLDFVNSIAIDLCHQDFVSCGPEQQDEVLHAVGVIPSRHAKGFIRMMIDLSLAGFLSDPRYGGNRDSVGWDYIGFSL